ncbi:MAG TPA: hypothetical protein PLN53_09855 [Terricaulis sp.]|nr:hypothetical protein [Terricaulis sp.]
MTLHDLPDAPPGFFTWRYQVGIDGRVSALFGTFARHRARAPGDAACAIAVLEHGAWREIASFPFRGTGCAWDVAPDDWCIVAATRSASSEPNATTFSHAGAVATFPLGDAIEHVQCDAANGFWVGYFDESRDPNGLARFLRNGEREFGYAGHILDCYSLNVARDAIWTCPYTDFQIVSMSLKGELREWGNASITGATALAVHGDRVALIGGYEGNRGRIALLELTDHYTELVGRTQLSDVFPGLAEEAQIVARGNCIYAIEADQYRVCAIADLNMG